METRLYVMCLIFGSNERRAATCSSPFLMKCETHSYHACLTSEGKGDTHCIYASRIGCMYPKILGLAHSLPTLSKISKNFNLSLSLCLDRPGHSRCCRLPSLSTPLSSTPASELTAVLDPGPEHAGASIAPLKLATVVDLKHATTSTLPRS
jgi:hypothetical protein